MNDFGVYVVLKILSCYDEHISKAKVDAFRVSAVKEMATEVLKILNNISPGYFEISKEPEIPTIYVMITN